MLDRTASRRAGIGLIVVATILVGISVGRADRLEDRIAEGNVIWAERVEHGAIAIDGDLEGWGEDAWTEISRETAHLESGEVTDDADFSGRYEVVVESTGPGWVRLSHVRVRDYLPGGERTGVMTVGCEGAR